MGSLVEINDTLRISKAQGFPAELDLARHLESPFDTAAFEGRVFEFHSKPAVRIYKLPPVRNFLVEDLDGKWVYWGLCHVLEVRHDYLARTTSGRFTITHVNSPAEMRSAFALVDRVWANDWFSPDDGSTASA